MNRAELKRRLDSLKERHHSGELPRWLHRELRKGAYASYRLTKPIRRSARRKVQYAVDKGELHRPGTCQGCGAAADVVGHHSNYDRPLAVEWLCPRCHAWADLQVADPAGSWWSGQESFLGQLWKEARLERQRAK